MDGKQAQRQEEFQLPAGAKRLHNHEAVATVLKRVAQEKVKWIDFQFVDLLGQLQHVSVPAHTLEYENFGEGVGKLDGSSIKGFKDIHESDMLLRPDPETFAVLPWYGEQHKTARMYSDVFEGASSTRFSRDPRYVAQKAEQAAASMGYDTTYWGPELEFFVFDSVKITPNATAARDAWSGCGYEIKSTEAAWSDMEGNAFPIRFKEGYYPGPPQDTMVDFRNEACRTLMEDFGMVLDAHHHEVATAGQGEIDMKYDRLVHMADQVITYKQVLKMTATRMGRVCTFMPKPIFGDNASGMHVHQSLWKNGKNTFYDPNEPYAEMSQTMRYYIGGLLEHSKALCAFTNPTTNSYRRLVPGYEAPVFIAYSKRNRSANIRIPAYYSGVEHAKRLEYRTPDTSCNPYLSFAALLAAGLDGIRKKTDPGNPVDEDIYKLTPEKRKALGVKELPGSLKEAMECLESDKGFLDGVFTADLIEKHVELKMDEFLQLSLRPTPYEFYKYLEV